MKRRIRAKNHSQSWKMGHDSLSSSSDQGKENIHELKCKSPQGGCIGEGVEDEGTSSFWVGDLHINAQGVVSCMGADPYFGSDPK